MDCEIPYWLERRTKHCSLVDAFYNREADGNAKQAEAGYLLAVDLDDYEEIGDQLEDLGG